MIRTHYISEASSAVGQTVTLAGWAHEVRDLGKVRFLLLRDKTGIIQVFGKKGGVADDVFDALAPVRETVIAVSGQIVASKIAAGGVELVPNKIETLGQLSVKVPVDVAGKTPAELDTRLDHRHVDLRRTEPSAIFKIKSEAMFAFRSHLRSEGFQEIVPPCIVAAATEGGTDVFHVKYFEREATLAQSPQLYKQLAVVGGMDKVFMTTPVFRAEKHNTTSHLNEVLQMDIEMGFCDEKDAMDVLERTTLSMLSHLSKNCPAELASLNSSIVVPESVPRHTYSSLVDKLNSAGVKMEWGEDFDREKEAKIMELIGKPELFFITDWPTDIRAFYSMPREEDARICRGFDLMFRGLEISSGAQRIHIPELLIKALRARNLNPDQFQFYIDAFRSGAPPHAGWSIGIERFVMKACNLPNIREAALFPRDRTRLTP